VVVGVVCDMAGCSVPAVAAYVNVFGVEQSACSEHSREIRRLVLHDHSVPCLVVTCGRYAVGVLGMPDGRRVWPACSKHRGQVRAANPEAEWVPAERAGSLRVLDMTAPVDAPAGVVVPPGAYEPDVPRCWVCGRRQGWEHDTAESKVSDGDQHEWQSSAGVVATMTPELRQLCRDAYLDGVQTGRARRGEPLLDAAGLEATFTPFDPPAEPGHATPKELAEIRRRYPELPAEHWHEYAIRAREATARRIDRERARG
jgi:hypothetical protein